MWIAIAGPAVHLVWLAVFWPLSMLVPLDTTWGQPQGWRTSPIAWGLDMTVYLNLVLMGFNLLPLVPMDGGRILRGWLAGRVHGNRATLVAAKVGMVGKPIRSMHCRAVHRPRVQQLVDRRQYAQPHRAPV